MKQTLYMIRHGHTSGTEAGIMYGATELLVTEDGLREIADLAETGIYPDPAGADLYTSGMIRTEQTFSTIYGDLSHDQEPLLKEMDIGIYEMKTIKELIVDDYARAWLSGELEDPHLEGGESSSGFAARISKGIHKVLDAARDKGTERVIVVIHGGPIVYTMNEFFPGVFKNVWSWTPAPGTGYAITIDEDGSAAWEPIGDIKLKEMPTAAEMGRPQ